MADRRRVALATPTQAPAAPSNGTVLTDEARRARKITRQPVIRRGNVKRATARADRDVAGPVPFPDAALDSFNQARQAIQTELLWLNEAIARKVLPAKACDGYAQSLAAPAGNQHAAETKARSAFGFLGSVSHALEAVGAVRTPRLAGRERDMKNRSASERMSDALSQAIPRAKAQCTAGAEADALNGASAASMMANLAQGPTRMKLISDSITRLATEIEALKRQRGPAAARQLQQQLRTLDATVQEARTLYPAMQAKVRALAKVADQAAAVLLEDAGSARLKGADRAGIQKAVQLCTTLKMALENLNEACADPGWVYAQLDRCTESVGRTLMA